MGFEIWLSAHRHGVEIADIEHAIRQRIKTMLTENDMVMIIGPERDGTVLEIGFGTSGAVVHAMRARKKYWPGEERR